MSDVEDLVELSRLLVSVAHRSLQAAGEPVTLQQFRALAVLSREGPQSSTSLAGALDLHPSTVSRLCDKLVNQGWVSREPQPANRREVQLDLTTTGRRLVAQVFAAREREVEQVLGRLPSASRRGQAAHRTHHREAPTTPGPPAPHGGAG